MTKVLAIASGGGHWEQIMLLMDSFVGLDAVFASTIPGLAEKAGIERLYEISDCNRNQPMAMVRCVAQLFGIVRHERPKLVVTTGAAPGLVGLLIGKVFGAHTIWIDSVANSERMSMSGRLAGLFVDLHLTQWKHLARGDRPAFMGSLL